MEKEEYFVSRDVVFIETKFPYSTNIASSFVTKNGVTDYSADDENSYVQNEMEEQQVPTSGVEHEVNVKIGNDVELPIDVNTRAVDKGVPT